MTSYFVNLIAINLDDVSRFSKFSIEIERAYQELIKNVVLDNFHQLN